MIEKPTKKNVKGARRVSREQQVDMVTRLRALSKPKSDSQSKETKRKWITERIYKQYSEIRSKYRRITAEISNDNETSSTDSDDIKSLEEEIQATRRVMDEIEASPSIKKLRRKVREMRKEMEETRDKMIKKHKGKEKQYAEIFKELVQRRNRMLPKTEGRLNNVKRRTHMHAASDVGEPIEEVQRSEPFNINENEVSTQNKGEMNGRTRRK